MCVLLVGICVGEAGGTFVDRPAYSNGSRGKVLERGFGIACIPSSCWELSGTRSPY